MLFLIIPNLVIGGGLGSRTIPLDEDGMHTFKTNKIALIEEGEVVIPIALDLQEKYVVCGKILTDVTLSNLFTLHKDFSNHKPHDPFLADKLTDIYNVEAKPSIRHGQGSWLTNSVDYDSVGRPKIITIDRKSRSENEKRKKRKKRFLPLLALGVGVVSLAWQGYSYFDTAGEIDTLRNEMRSQLGYVAQLVANSERENMRNFIAIRRAITDSATANSAHLCNVTESTYAIINEHYFSQEFDDIIQSMHSQRLTTKIIPASQLADVILKSPALAGTIYYEKPFLLYYNGKIQFDLSETGRSILRGVLIVPIIKRFEAVSLSLYTRNVQEGVRTIFGPEYILNGTQLSVGNCKREINIYTCKRSDLNKPIYVELNEPYLIDDGLIIVNANVSASVRLKGASVAKTNVGPFICVGSDVDMVVVNNYQLFTSGTEFYIHQPFVPEVNISRDFDIRLENSSIIAIEEYIRELEKLPRGFPYSDYIHKYSIVATMCLFINVWMFYYLLFVVRPYISRLRRDGNATTVLNFCSGKPSSSKGWLSLRKKVKKVPEPEDSALDVDSTDPFAVRYVPNGADGEVITRGI